MESLSCGPMKILSKLEPHVLPGWTQAGTFWKSTFTPFSRPVLSIHLSWTTACKVSGFQHPENSWITMLPSGWLSVPLTAQFLSKVSPQAISALPLASIPVHLLHPQTLAQAWGSPLPSVFPIVSIGCLLPPFCELLKLNEIGPNLLLPFCLFFSFIDISGL